MNNDMWKGVGVVGIGLLVIVLVLLMVYMGASLAGRAECEALGFEFGIYTLVPLGVQCEYRLRVPLREVLPPIDGGNDDTPYIPSDMAL